jgi:shikimate kinase
MRSSGVVLGLTASRETLLARLGSEASRRPLLAGDAGAALEAVLRERRHLYRRADLTLDTEGLGLDAVAGALVGLLRSLQGPLVRPGAAP